MKNILIGIDSSARRVIESHLCRFYLLRPRILGCAKLKEDALGDVKHATSYASG